MISGLGGNANLLRRGARKEQEREGQAFTLNSDYEVIILKVNVRA
jgi:hypothetical protein